MREGAAVSPFRGGDGGFVGGVFYKSLPSCAVWALGDGLTARQMLSAFLPWGLWGWWRGLGGWCQGGDSLRELNWLEGGWGE